MFNLQVTGTTYQGEARVIASGAHSAVLQVNAEQIWSAEELRKVAALLQSAANLMEA